jgi:hypothetical protein
MNMQRLTTFILACLLGVLAGCAGKQVSPTISFMMGTSANASGGSGELFISSTAKTAGGISIGKLRDSDGNPVGDIVTTSPLDAMMLHSFRNEMKAAGYGVTSGETPPLSAVKAIELGKFELTLDQVKGLTRDEAKCAMGIAVKVFKNGSLVRTLSYEAANSNVAVRDRDDLAQSVFDTSLSSLLRQAVPEIIAILEQQ